MISSNVAASSKTRMSPGARRMCVPFPGCCSFRCRYRLITKNKEPYPQRVWRRIADEDRESKLNDRETSTYVDNEAYRVGDTRFSCTDDKEARRRKRGTYNKNSSDTNDNDTSVSLLDGGFLERILDFLQASPLGLVFIPLGIILRPIFYLVDLILSPVFFLVRVILSPIEFILNLVLLPINGVGGVLGDVSGLVSFLLSNASTIVSLLLSNASGLLSVVLRLVSEDTGLGEPVTRRKRAIMDSVISMAWGILSSPFSFVTEIISTILSPFYFIYRVITWPYHFLFGDDTDGALTLSSDYLNDLVRSILVNVSESSQDALFELIKYAWVTFRERLLPALDRLFVWAADSDLVPDDIKKYTRTLHTGYNLLRTIGVL